MLSLRSRRVARRGPHPAAAMGAGWMVLLAPAATCADWAVTDRVEIRRSFPLASGARSIEVDNVNGPIEVVGEDRDDVRLVVVRATEARSQDALARADREVRLDLDAGPSHVVVYVDGPFRCGKNCFHQRGSPGYTVRFDVALRVPRRADLDLKTVNDGDLVVRGVDGLLEVGNVNGGIEMTSIGGAVRAGAVNGAIRVVFNSSPRDSCSFESVNGDLDVTFPPDLRADIRAKSYNGEIWTAFEGEPLPSRAVRVDKSEGSKTVYRIDARLGWRVGGGGPAIAFDAFNGDVRIRTLER